MNKKIESLISISMFNKNLTDLTGNLNKLLIFEEKSRSQSACQEKKIKEMITNISHDLRTPLTAVKGYMELLARNLQEEKQKKTAGTIIKHIDQLDKLINCFFELSYLEMSDDNIELSKVNLTNTLCNSIVNYIYEFEKRDIKVEINTEQPLYVVGNEEMIKRIIENLIKNCLVHSYGNVKVNISEEDENIVLSFANKVKETEKIDTDNLFDKFYVADKSRNKTTTGLGLSIVKKLCEKMNGSVKAILNGSILDIKVILLKSDK
ncbi:sensor histidine kinase [Clostridium saccharobutylicum]|uniref:histidine kinase n=2 Tax=Clostridium saccharobutylicum TaxID=169679 RepID=U5MQJ9_CLOSA|nr:HAMP domain-containing sensor histidine kinase [Clostridium saccharobutylicum]AGX43069.1 sensor histidine kinase YcbM [Clostridium saccharobutylicum DSM 13864]AQR90363.1 alkaline phosphatase synthesis sensor protein PhoR [Clostridium saccharobutylicum]AQS00269.1 alkaline phosphatase synthesis sensor protein PhoR [Clostridium saccharobutylicum]AQS14252.1 alkaline phosphatase synthesis sensor protein PhoR [Clostridium saccharobutylicum]MBA2907589.1 signal transduction histidine kinase [Clostr